MFDVKGSVISINLNYSGCLSIFEILQRINIWMFDNGRRKLRAKMYRTTSFIRTNILWCGPRIAYKRYEH